MAEQALKDLVPSDPAKFRDLLKRAQNGDTTTLDAVRELLKDRKMVENMGGNLARQAELSLIESASGKNLLFKEALTNKLGLLRAELAGPNPSPLESLLVDRVVTCWLHLHDAEIRVQQAGSVSLPLGIYNQKRIERLHKQYLSAIKTLATVRRLAIPVLIGQINIAEKQVNKGTVVNQNTKQE